MSTQPPYGGPADGPAGGPARQGPYQPYPVRPPDHPQATTVLVLGILGLALCQILGPFAWSMGNRVLREIDASGGRLGSREQANIGRILGIVSTVLLIAGVGFFVLVAVLQVVALGGMFAFSDY